MFSAAEALGLVMAVLDGHHDVGGSDRPGRRGTRQDRPRAARVRGRTGGGGPPDHVARPRPGRGPPRSRDHHRPGAGLCRPSPGQSWTTAPKAGSEWDDGGRPLGGRRPARTLVSALPLAHGGCPARLPDRPGAFGRDDRRDGHPAAGPRSGRDARGAPRGRMGVRGRGDHRGPAPPGAGPVAEVARTGGTGRRVRHPSRGEHQQSSVVRRATRRHPGVLPDRRLR